MIADWTVEIGPDSPSIDVPWEGWIDLRWEWRRDSLLHIPEMQAFPELHPVLEALNSSNSFAGLLTSKVDVFPISRDEVDPEIAEAGLARTAFGLGSYTDVLATRADLFTGFERFESVARLVSANLSKMEVPSPCLAEVLVRPASLFGAPTFGWTLYALGFGPTQPEARAAWSAASAALYAQFVDDVQALAKWWHNASILSDASA